MDTPYVIVERDTVPSTQDLATEEFVRRGAPVLVVAAAQESGRGRGGRPWWNADRAMAASFAFSPPWSVDDWPLLPLVAALAARDAIAATTGVQVALKWPNDLMVDGLKVGGILVEGTDHRVAVGMGLDLWWKEAPEGAGALFGDDPGPDVGREIAVRWVDRFLQRLARPARDWGHDEYRSVCTTVGREVEWDDGRGRAVDIAPGGGLVIETADGLVEVMAGGVRVRPAGTMGTREEDRP